MTIRHCTFGPLRVSYDDGVLAPRPWTLVQSRAATALLHEAPAGPILELHCGAGHIGQATASWSDRPIVQVDDDAASCLWAQRNAARNGVAADVRWTSIADLNVASGSFALVLADPPYLPSDETARFPEDPEHAIDGGADGLAGIRVCLPVTARWARPGGTVVLQVRGPEQAAAVSAHVAASIPALRPIDSVTVDADRAVMVFERV